MRAAVELSEESRVDFARHGIVEAHAGTGKTHTIVQRMALRLVSEPLAEGRRLHVNEILLVTYTEKAAGELRERLRGELEKRLAGEADPELRTHLLDCLKRMGEAWIGTIHSVALRILRAFPFESSMPLKTEIVDDAEGIAGTLREVLRADGGPWSSLTESVRERLGALGMETLEDDALALAPHLLDAGAEFEFGSAREREDRAKAASQAALPAWERLRERIGSELLPALDALPGSRKVANLARKWREELDALPPPRSLVQLSSVKSGPPSFSADKPEEAAGLEAWARLERMWDSDYAPAAAGLSDALALAELDPSTVDRTEFVRDWAKAAVALWRERKRGKGWVSYADMVERLREGLEDPALLRILRERIRVGVIDEFQDTGAAPWAVFRRWFLEGAGGGTLFLVGDPKQSIYSFQGADLGCYFRACRELEEAGAVRYSLRRNYRSLPETVEAVNGLLTGDPPWFLPERLEYPVEGRALAARREEPPPPTPAGVPALRVFEGGDRAADVRKAWADEVAADISALRGARARVPKGGGWDAPRPLDWGDFAIVVSARSQARSFAEALSSRGVPWAFYKQEGVFGSRCAREWALLLTCLDEGGDAGILPALAATRVFGIAVGAWDPAAHMAGPGSPGEVVARWRSLALKGRWGELLRSASLETGWTDRILSGSDPDRQWMDHRQVREWIHLQLREAAGGPREVAARLGRLASGDERAGEDRNLFQRATDARRVQILTMHASKGLEFPVVYLGGGRGNAAGPRRPSTWNTPEGLRVRPGFLPVPPQSVDQAEAESRRLLYVALTRAQLLCAIPILKDLRGKPHDSLAAVLDGRSLPPQAAAWSPADPAEVSEVPAPSADRGAVVDRADLVGLDLARRTLRQASFTAVARNLASHTLEGRPGRSEEDDETAPTASWLPRGARTGDALHEILELLLSPEADLGWVGTGAEPGVGLPRIRSVLGLHGLSQVDPARVLDLLARTLRAPLEFPGGEILRIADILGRDRRCEVEFLRGQSFDGSPAGPGGRIAGWVVGHLDLLLRAGGRWYVVDWKSNDLPAWDPESVERAVREHRYDLQAALYAQAVRDAMPGAEFGGCAWIFLRGAGEAGVPAWIRGCGGGDDPEVDGALRAWREKGEEPWTR